jgi:DNA-directed RNA polymerase specialized sigma24 family protein
MSRLHRLLRDDLDAGFEQLVRENVAGLVTFTGRICRDGADDVTQETLLKAFRSLRSMPDDQLELLDLRPWLYTIARNTAYNAVRAAKRRPQTVGANGHELVAPPALPPFDSALRDALDRLPEVQRDAVVLRHVLDLSLRDAAAILACPENTVKSHVARGLQSLRNDLKGNLT